MLLSQALSPVAIKNGIKPAFNYLKKPVSYKEFWETSSRFSYFLQKEIGHGLRVGLWMSNCPHIAYCFIALTNTKSCTVPLNPWATPAENLFKIKNSGVTVILCTSDHVKTLKDLLNQNGLNEINVIDMEGKRCTEYDVSYTPPANHSPNDKDHILLFYTPGTTGKYKGCLFNHNAVTAAMTGVKGGYRTLGTDVFFTQQTYSNPYTFIHFLLAPLLAGATVYISDQTDPKTLLDGLVEGRVTRFSPNLAALPGLIKFSIEEKMPIVTVRQIIVNGGTMPPDTWTALKAYPKIGVVNIYGMTEYLGTFAMSTSDFMWAQDKAGFIGPPLVGTKIRLLDDNNDEIDKKKPQKGQLAVMGPANMDKYLELPEDQKMTMRGTWMFTGDIVEIDKDGCLIFHDRKADVVSIGEGMKIYAKEIEPVVKQMPEIEDAAYIGTRDRLKKPTSALVIVKKAQANLNEKQVRDYMVGKLPGNKIPNAIFFTDAMPRTISGAINRAKLRGQYDGA